MGALSSKILGYLVIFGGTAFVLMYITDPLFRDRVNQIFMGTGAHVAHITN